MTKEIIIYQSRTGAIEFKGDFKKETIWANLQQIADLFEIDKSGTSRHINNIYKSKELKRKLTVAIFATVQKEGGHEVKRDIEYYNLDTILSVGYRINSKKATSFRQWATKVLRAHIIAGYSINKTRISKNYDTFLQAVEGVKKLLPVNGELKTEDVLELVKMFASTWVSLQAYDKSEFPKNGTTKQQITITTKQINEALMNLKSELISQKEASELFGIEKEKDNVAGIIGNVFQSFDEQDLYQTIEEKAAHLLYFFVKNHPFIDGNKRSGALVFIWFLNKAKVLNTQKLSPIALTALTLLVAESNPKDKNRVIGLILLLLIKL